MIRIFNAPPPAVRRERYNKCTRVCLRPLWRGSYCVCCGAYICFVADHKLRNVFRNAADHAMQREKLSGVGAGFYGSARGQGAFGLQEQGGTRAHARCGVQRQHADD